MPWESRPGGGRYYTRSRRVNGRLVREYLGTGPAAEAAAAADAVRRRQDQAERDALHSLDQSIHHLDDLAELLTQAALLAAGYHRHDRGPWRKCRASARPAGPTPGPD